MDEKKNRNNEEEKQYFNKEDAYRTLELTNSWVGNVDTKISFALALVGVLSAFVFKDGLPSAFQTVIDKGNWSLITGGDIIAAIFVALLYLASFSSLVLLLLGMMARTKAKGDSIFFFGTIGAKKLEDYKSKIKGYEEEHIKDDLIEQIHTNSQICKKKMWFYNKGILLILVTVILWFVCMIFQLI